MVKFENFIKTSSQVSEQAVVYYGLTKNNLGVSLDCKQLLCVTKIFI